MKLSKEDQFMLACDCSACTEYLNKWERKFLSNVISLDGLSEKQEAKLLEIRQRLDQRIALYEQRIE